MKQREARNKVMLPVRIRQDSGWGDACIRNVSSRGLMLQIEDAPPKGSFIEIRRQNVVIVGQVRWSRGDCCGLRSQDRIPVAELMTNGAVSQKPRFDDAGFVERRTAARVLSPHEIAEASRMKSVLFQRATFIAGAVIAALVLASLLFDVLNRPMAMIAAKLG